MKVSKVSTLSGVYVFEDVFPFIETAFSCLHYLHFPPFCFVYIFFKARARRYGSRRSTAYAIEEDILTCGILFG